MIDEINSLLLETMAMFILDISRIFAIGTYIGRIEIVL
jgi:hypothetical protein